MKKINPLKNRILLIIALAFCCVKLSAQDKITFTYHIPTDNYTIEIIRLFVDNPDNTFAVNWGDGEIENYTGDEINRLYHTYATSGTYTVNITAIQNRQFTEFWCHNQNITNLSISNCQKLRQLHCFENQLTQLNITSPNLEFLVCSNNQLTQLNITATKLTYLACVNNKLQLSDLYAAHLLVKDGWSKYLGTQNLSPTWVSSETELFASQSIFNGIYTQYAVEIEGVPAPDSAYTVTDGKLIFHTLGTYTITMTNDAIISNEEYPAKVIVVLDVVPLGISENDFTDLKVYPNPTTGILTIQISDYPISDYPIFDIVIYDRLGRIQQIGKSQIGKSQINISHLPAGIYFVKIRTEAGEVVKKVVKE